VVKGPSASCSVTLTDLNNNSLTCIYMEKKRIVIQIMSYINDKVTDCITKYLVDHGDSSMDIDLLLDSEGGSLWPTLAILTLLTVYKQKNPNAKIRAYVYCKACSAATVLALFADELYCSEYSLFSGINLIRPSTSQYGVNLMNNTVDLLPSDKPLEAQIIAFKMEDKYCSDRLKEMLESHRTRSEHAETIFNALYYPFSHCENISYKRLEEIGCKRSGPVPPEILGILKTYDTGVSLYPFEHKKQSKVVNTTQIAVLSMAALGGALLWFCPTSLKAKLT
jgi:hypothetical protein